MQYEPSPLEVLFLWGLVAGRGVGWKKELKPELEPKSRENLRKAGLLAVEKRKKGALWIELTDKGWVWAAKNLDADISSRSPASGPILRAWLTRLKTYIANNDIALAEIISGQPIVRDDDANGHDQTLGERSLATRIADAYLLLSGGNWAQRVRIAQLRHKLEDVPKDNLDAELLNMQRDGKLALYTLDDPRQISTDDKDAAIRIGSATRHILYMENNSL